MASARLLRWSIFLFIAAGSLASESNEVSSESSEIQESVEVQNDESLEQTSEETTIERKVRNAGPFFSTSKFHSELQENFPFVQDLGFPQRKISTRRKRGSGVVIRGPFYPYPRPGHPLRYISGEPAIKASSSLIVFISFLTVSFATFYRT